jgi:WD40 repeat protein
MIRAEVTIETTAQYSCRRRDFQPASSACPLWDPKTQSELPIHETLSGRTLLAFPASTRWVRNLTFSPDGRQLAIAIGDGTIEVWWLPEIEIRKLFQNP